MRQCTKPSASDDNIVNRGNSRRDLLKPQKTLQFCAFLYPRWAYIYTNICILIHTYTYIYVCVCINFKERKKCKLNKRNYVTGVRQCTKPSAADDNIVYRGNNMRYMLKPKKHFNFAQCVSSLGLYIYYIVHFSWLYIYIYLYTYTYIY